MKKFLLAVIFTLCYHFTFAQWQKVNVNDTFPRSRPATFVIGDTAYLGNGDPGFFIYAPNMVPANQDFYGYTQAGNTWNSIRQYPGGGGDWGIRFQIGDTAYIGGGANSPWQNDFWKYDPKNGWQRLGTTPSGLYMGCNSSFSIGNKGYVCGGDNSGTAIDSFWEYDPITNKFTSKAPYPGGTMQSGVAFSSNGYGYVGLGSNGGAGVTFKTMYRYNPVTNIWDTMAPIPSRTGFSDAGFFVICGKLFVTMGDKVQSGDSTSNQTWLYDPYNGLKGSWYRLPDYPGPLPSYGPGAFAMHDTGFIYGGWNQLPGQYTDRGEMYRFLPTRYYMHMLATPLDTTICSGNSVTLRGTASKSYLWNTSDTTANITVTPTNSASYTVVETSGGCVYIDTVNVTVLSGTALSITPQAPVVCSGQSVTLTVSGGSGANLSWSPPTGLNAASGDTVIASPNSTTTYTVSTGSGACSSNSSVVVTVGNSAIGGNVGAVRDTLCVGTPGNLSLSGSSGKEIQWQSSIDDADFINAPNDTSVNYKTNPLLQTTWYRATVGSGNCSAVSDTFQLYVPPALTAYFQFTQPGSNQLSFNCDSSSGSIRSYHWDFGDGKTSTDKNPQHTYAKDTTYYVCLTLFDGSNCSYTFCRYSEVTDGVPNLSAAGKWVVYPNSFSNSFSIDGGALNRTVESIELYDVLGRLVFNKNYEAQNSKMSVDLSGFAQGMYSWK